MRGLVRGRVLGRWEGIAVRFAINMHEIDKHDSGSKRHPPDAVQDGKEARLKSVLEHLDVDATRFLRLL